MRRNTAEWVGWKRTEAEAGEGGRAQRKLGHGRGKIRSQGPALTLSSWCSSSLRRASAGLLGVLWASISARSPWAQADRCSSSACRL